MKMNYWKVEEVEFIKKHYEKEGGNFCADSLGRTPKAVNKKAAKLGIRISKIEFVQRSMIVQAKKFDESGKSIASPEAWKKRVKRIFNFTCANCNLFCPTICVAHHIEEQAKSPHLKYEVNNGVCLCPNCHALRHVDIGRILSGKRIGKTDKQTIRELYNAGISVEKISKIMGLNHKTISIYK